MLLNDKRLQPYKHRIHFYEGHHIEELFVKSYRDIKELYVAQLNELYRNIEIADSIHRILSVGGIIVGKYINYNLPILINRLSMFEDQKTLREKLEMYQYAIERDNNIITYMPIKHVLMGSKSEKQLLIEGAKRIVSLSKELIALIVDTLTEK